MADVPAAVGGQHRGVPEPVADPQQVTAESARGQQVFAPAVNGIGQHVIVVVDVVVAAVGQHVDDVAVVAGGVQHTDDCDVGEAGQQTRVGVVGGQHSVVEEAPGVTQHGGIADAVLGGQHEVVVVEVDTEVAVGGQQTVVCVPEQIGGTA
jgi:hypothetical protein